MRLYKLTDTSGKTADLDDDAVYRHLPAAADELRDRMLRQVGFALSYMDFIHRDAFPLDNPQRVRVTKLVAKFWREGYKDRDRDLVDAALKVTDPKWLREQVFVFEDEIENMC